MPGPDPRRSAIAASVAAVVLGILGMHAFEAHCPIPVPGATHADAHMDDMDGAHDGAHMDDLGAAVESVAGSVPLAPVPGEATLCVAMLLAALAGAALVGLLGRARETAGQAHEPAVRSRVRPTCQVRATGPPPVLSFVVIRC